MAAGGLDQEPMSFDLRAGTVRRLDFVAHRE
jgi:hypothetical protein